MYISFIGDIFLRMLKCLSIPLIVASLVSTIATLDVSLSGKIAARAVGLYIILMFMGVVLGIILVTVVKPGQLEAGYAVATKTNLRNVTTIDTMLDLVR